MNSQNLRRSLKATSLGKLFGPIFILVLFALAEISPETIADQNNPLLGKWTGRTAASLNTFTLSFEDDQSFSWLAGEKRLMSGTYELQQGKLTLHFGDSAEETLEYALNFTSRNSFKMRQKGLPPASDFNFQREEPTPSHD